MPGDILTAFSSTRTVQPAWFSTYLSHQPTVACFEVENARISYRHWRNVNKPGLLFVHGHAAHARWWDFIAPAFRDSHNVATIDLSGSGDSSHRAVYSARLFSREIVGCIQASGLNSTTVVGHSFGGTMARTTAYLYPEQITTIILADSNIPTHKGSRRPPPKPRGKYVTIQACQRVSEDSGFDLRSLDRRTLSSTISLSIPWKRPSRVTASNTILLYSRRCPPKKICRSPAI